MKPPAIRRRGKQTFDFRLNCRGIRLALDRPATLKEVRMIRKLAMFTFVLCVPAVMLAQTPEKKPTVVKKAPAQTKANDGQEMFTSYCAPCHGRQGKGDGPAAAALTPKPTDLTQFAKRHGGTFSAKDFEDKLRGMSMSPAHGSTDMPVWGPIFSKLGNDQLRTYNLRKYVEGLQTQ
jgi:mono/diheme cytochrome c family protein